MIHFTLITVQMYSSPLRFQQNKLTQESLKGYELAQKRQIGPNVATTKIFTSPYICNNSRMALLTVFSLFL